MNPDFFQILRERQFCGILVDFAIQLMTLLEQINRDSFQRFQLRAGLNQVKKLFHRKLVPVVSRS